MVLMSMMAPLMICAAVSSRLVNPSKGSSNVLVFPNEVKLFCMSSMRSGILVRVCCAGCISRVSLGAVGVVSRGKR